MRSLVQFFIRYYFFFLFLLLEGIALFLVINNNYYQRSIIFNTANTIAGNIYSISHKVTQYLSLKSANEMLAEENAKLLNLQDGSFIKTDNKVFTVDDTLYRMQYQYLSAEVINNSTNRPTNYITLNKGAKHGITKGMAVICPAGIVGIVNNVSDNFCSVMSLLHPRVKVSAKIKKNNYVGTMIWKGSDYRFGSLKDVPTHVELAAGDTIITSGYSLIFPEGTMIGVISGYGINEGNDFYDISVKYSTHFNDLSFVYVVSNLMKEELENLEKSSQINE